MDRSTLPNWLDRLEELDADAHGHVQSYVAANALAQNIMMREYCSTDYFNVFTSSDKLTFIGTSYERLHNTFVDLKTKQQEGKMLPLHCLRRLFNHLKEIAVELMGEPRLHDIVIETPMYQLLRHRFAKLGVDVSDPTRTYMDAHKSFSLLCAEMLWDCED